MNINTLKIIAVVAFLALPGCATGPKRETSHQADLTRVDGNPPMRVAIMFTASVFGREGVLFDREQDDMPETVIRLHCSNLVPEWVQVRQGATQVLELADEPFVYEICNLPTDLEIYFMDGNSIVKRIFTVDDGELTLKPVEVAANISRY